MPGAAPASSPHNQLSLYEKAGRRELVLLQTFFAAETNK